MTDLVIDTKTYTLSTSLLVNVPQGLYITIYFIYIINPSTTVSSIINNSSFSITDAVGTQLNYWNNCSPYTLVYSATKSSNIQTFSNTTIINVQSTQNYTLGIGINYTGNALYWGSTLSFGYSYFQFVKIG